MISASFSGDLDPKKFVEVMTPRIQEVGRVIGRHLATKTAQVVRIKIPSGGGWTSIYKAAIRYRETDDGTRWAIHGWAQMELSTPPAESTLITIEGDPSNPVAGFMMAQNPWVVDAIPAVAGGYAATARADPAAPSVVAARRGQLLAIRSQTQTGLVNLGARVLPWEFTPQFRNGVFADLAFLACSLEHGANGLPRHPHWSTAAGKLSAQGARWASQTVDGVNKALMGKQLPSTDRMSPSQADELAKMRESDWS